MQSFAEYKMLGILICSVVSAGEVVFAQPRAREDVEGQGTALQLTTAPADSRTLIPGPSTRVRWDDNDYDVEKGISVLMEIIVNNANDNATRGKALSVLRSLIVQLRGMDCIDQLVTLYPALKNRDLKCGVLLCLGASNDPRTLPVFSTVLDQETDEALLLFASGGLAGWNIRLGADRLVRLFDSTSVLPNKRTLGEEALLAFQSFNRIKAWAFRNMRFATRNSSAICNAS